MSLILTAPRFGRRIRTGEVTAAISTTSGRYWRVKITDNNGGSSTTVAELKFYDENGALLDTFTNRVPDAFANAEANSSNEADEAFDEDNSTKWTDALSTSFPAWIGFDFGSQVTVSKIVMMGQYNTGDQATFAPKDFVVQASDDNISYEDVSASFTAETGWGGAEERTFLVQEPVGDSDFASVSLLLGFDGTDGNTTPDDESDSAHTVSVTGNAHKETDQSKFGGASLALDGSGDWIDCGTSADLNFGTGDFTVEFWIYPNANGATDIYAQAWVSGGSGKFAVYAASGELRLFAAGGNQITAAGAISTGAWQHIALVRSSGTTKLYVDGTQVGSGYADSNDYDSTDMRIGANDVGSTTYNGYIDEFRVTKGVARYTSGFTPPTAPFPRAAAA